MRNMLVKGAFIVGGAGALLPGAPVAAEINPERCDPIYQEFEQTPDRELRNSMGAILDDYGVEVRIQLLDEGSDEKITHTDEVGADEAKDYIARTAEACDWSDDLLAIVAVRSPRVYRVTTEGSGHEEFPDDIVKGSAEDTLRKNLGDTSSPMQADIRQYLEDIRGAKQASEVPGWLVIGGLVTGTIVAAGVGYWLLRDGGGSGGGGYGSASYISMSISSGNFGSSSGGTGGSY